MKNVKSIFRLLFVLPFFIVLLITSSCTDNDVIPLDIETNVVLKNFSSSVAYTSNFSFNSIGQVLDGSVNGVRDVFTYNSSNKLLQTKQYSWAYTETVDYIYNNDILDSINFFSIDDTGATVSTKTKLKYQGNIVERFTYDENNVLTLSEKLVFLSNEYKYLSRLETHSIYSLDIHIDFEYDANHNIIRSSYERYLNTVRQIRYDCHLSYDTHPNPFKGTLTYESQLYRDVFLFYEMAPYLELGEAFKWSTNNVTKITVHRDNNTIPESIYDFQIEYDNNNYPIRKNLLRSLYPNTPILYEYTYY